MSSRHAYFGPQFAHLKERQFVLIGDSTKIWQIGPGLLSKFDASPPWTFKGAASRQRGLSTRLNVYLLTLSRCTVQSLGQKGACDLLVVSMIMTSISLYCPVSELITILW